MTEAVHKVRRFASKWLTLRGFIVHDFAGAFEAARRKLAAWIRTGRLLHRPTIVEGIEIPQTPW